MGTDESILYLLSTTDAAVWAAVFMELHGNRLAAIDEGLMISWFANAIETGRSAGERPQDFVRPPKSFYPAGQHGPRHHATPTDYPQGRQV